MNKPKKPNTKPAEIKKIEANPNTSEGTQTGELRTIKLPNSFDLLGYPQNVAALLAAHKFSGEIRSFVVSAIEATDDEQFLIELKDKLALAIDRPGNAIRLMRGKSIISTLHFSVLD